MSSPRFNLHPPHQAAAEGARRKLADTEAATRTMAAQAELIDKRRCVMMRPSSRSSPTFTSA